MEKTHIKKQDYSLISINKVNQNSHYNQIQGKELSYNNFNDADAAFELVNEFNEPAVAIIKHANPCGVSQNQNITKAWENAFNTDKTSAFGGIVALNRTLTMKWLNKCLIFF